MTCPFRKRKGTIMKLNMQRYAIQIMVGTVIALGCVGAYNAYAMSDSSQTSSKDSTERKPAMSIMAGNEAPGFKLSDAAGKQVALKDLAGSWVVLYFYPKDDTPGCTTEACEFTASIADFRGLNAKVVGISPDSPESHAKFIEKHKLAVTLLSDPEHKVMETYGAWGTKMTAGKESVGVTRSTVIIDPKGKIAHYWPTVTAKGHAEEVRKVLEELQVKK